MKFNVAVATLALSAAALSPAHATIVTIRATGTIGQGLDQTGLFGIAGGDLTGKTFTQSISGDIDQMRRISAPAYDYVVNNGPAPAFSVTTTIDSHAASFSFPASRGVLQLNRGQAIPGSYDQDGLYAEAQGAWTNGNATESLNTFMYVFTHTPFAGAADLTGYAGYMPDARDSRYFNFNFNNGLGVATYFNGYQLSLIELNPETVSNPDANVPEPATLGLFVIGMLGAMAARRRQQD